MTSFKIKLNLFGFFLVALFVLASCKKDHITPVDNQGLVSASPIKTLTKTELQTLAAQNGAASSAALMQYDVDFYQVTYKTTYNGTSINASGLLAVPKNMPAAPALLSAQHGTIFSDAEAPSNFPDSFTGFEPFASEGYITLIPDYIGYGASKNIIHPYYDMKSSGVAVADMIKAVKYFLKSQHIAFSDKLFLLGYSEGGYVTLAAEKEIETNPAYNLKLTAVAAGAGGYDISGLLSILSAAPVYNDPALLALFIQSYNTTYKWNRPLTDFFQQPYASEIPQLLNGAQTGTQIDHALTNTPSLLFNPVFYKSINDPSAEAAFKAKVAENSFPGWYPATATRLYHGTADVDVPFVTSQTTYNKFITAGAAKLTLTPIEGGTHLSSVGPMVQDATAWFGSFTSTVTQ